MENPDSRQAKSGFVDATDAPILNDLKETIKADLLAGKSIRLIDFPEKQRQIIHGIIAVLRDELPVRAGWVTVRESHLSETRLRARTYRVQGEFLKGCA